MSGIVSQKHGREGLIVDHWGKAHRNRFSLASSAGWVRDESRLQHRFTALERRLSEEPVVIVSPLRIFALELSVGCL